MNIKEIINNYGIYSPEYGGGLTNHLPMAQFALYKMGASEDRIINHSNEYIEGKGIKRAIKYDFIINDISDELGDEKAYLNYVDYYRNQLRDNGMHKTVRNVLNELSGGLASGLFHGIIRVSYALESGNEEELCRALAFYSSIYKEIRFADRTINKAVLNEELLKIIIDNSDDNFYLEGELEEKEIALLESLTELYFSTGSFIVLHGITGFHALMNLKEYYDDFNEVFDRFTVCVQRALLRVTVDLFTKVIVENKHDSWNELFALACSVNDPHTIKLVYSCNELSKIFNIDKLMDIANIKLLMDHDL